MLTPVGLALALLGVTASVAPVAPQRAATAGLVTRDITVGGERHRIAVWIPPDWSPGRSWPGVVFLHGSGECGDDGLKPARVGLGPALEAHPGRWPCVVVFPQKPREDEEWEEREDLVFAALDTAAREFHLDSTRIALTGVSQGGHGTWMIGARHPGRWSCLAPVCGYGRALTVADRVIELPVWAFHGLRDDVVNPADTRAIVEGIRAERARAGLPPADESGARMTLYPGANHASWDSAYAEPALAPWMLSRRRAAPGSRTLSAGQTSALLARYPGLGTIRAADLMSTVEMLAAPGMEGRLAGGPGFMRAARAMASRFRALGLSPAGEDGWFQHLDVEYETIDACRLARVMPDGSSRELHLGPDFVCRSLTGSGTFTAPVAFVGYGLSQPARGYDDYAGIDVRGKVVMVIKEPPPFTPDTLGWGDAALPRPRAHVAAAHGAMGMLLVSPPLAEHPQQPIGSMLQGEGVQEVRFPQLHIDVPVAESLAAPAGVALRDLQAAIDSSHAPRSRDLGSRVHVEVRARYEPRRPSVNVVARLEGSDPVLAKQAVVIGAHLDHVGTQAGRLVFRGANDNASGSAAVLALARAFASAGLRPKRTVIFALFSSEESGLYGAKHFVAHPPVPLARIVAYLNLDCVGHGDGIQLGSGKTSPRLWRLARDLDQRAERLTVEETWGGGGADATPFAEAGLPTLYFATTHSYTHLHLASDTPETLDPPLFEALTRLAYRTARTVAEGDYAGEP